MYFSDGRRGVSGCALDRALLHYAGCFESGVGGIEVGGGVVCLWFVFCFYRSDDACCFVLFFFVWFYRSDFF